MPESEFVYVTYIRTTPEKLWQALTQPEFTRKFWVDTVQECDWKQGASWKLTVPDGRVADAGEVVEIDPPRKLVLTWQNHLFPDANAGTLPPLTPGLTRSSLQGPSVMTLATFGNRNA